MVQEIIERYHAEINAYVIKQYNQQIPLQSLLAIIEKRKSESTGNRPNEEFYQGEIFFYEGQYDRALKHYLLASSVPNLPFYCYRATASLFLSQGNNDKALGFTQKALKIYPDDFTTLKILEKLLLQSNQPEDLAEVQNKIKSLEQVHHIEDQSVNQVQTITETPMNSGSDIFSFPKVEETVSTSTLTERLYPTQANPIPDDPYKPKREAAVFSHLQKISTHTAPKDDILGRRIESFQNDRNKVFQSYVETAKENSVLKEDALFFLSGFPSPQTDGEESLFLSDSLRKPTGGIYLRWEGKGVVVNPGRHFLENFHERGLTVRDIHFVIVTNDLPESSSDVQAIYDLNYHINKTSQDIHIIHYYFSQKAFQELSKTLKPHFKQERGAIHHLDLFVDSPDVETTLLSPDISMHYFLVSPKENSGNVGSTLGIKLDLKREGSESHDLSLGFVSNAAWSPLLSTLLGRCDLLIAGFGDTSPSDYNKITYNSDSLGYHGVANLLHDTSPQLLLIGDFNGKDGDIRLEVVQKLRDEFARINATTVLPADHRLVVDLRTLMVQCLITQQWTPATQIRAIRSGDFDDLVYISSDCFC